MFFDIKHRFSGAVLSSPEIEATEDTPFSIKIGLAVKWATKSNADLSYADLRYAKEMPDFTMTDGIKFSKYKAVVVPALLMAGGKTLDEIKTAGCWNCHSWTNCPMAIAFNVEKIEDIPLLYRTRAQEFIQFFDGGLIPAPWEEPPVEETTETEISPC